MKRLKILILIFYAALSIPLAYMAVRTYQGIEQEERSQLRYFAETLFDEMERELAMIVRKEEARAIDEYHYFHTPAPDAQSTVRSPLSYPPSVPYILGYFQNNPDGSFQTPREPPGKALAPSDQTLSRLRDVNQMFNQKRKTSEVFEMQPVLQAEPSLEMSAKQEKIQGFADRYLNLSRSRDSKVYLGQKEKRVEEISPSQAQNLARQEPQTLLDFRRPQASEVKKSDNEYPPAVSGKSLDEGISAWESETDQVSPQEKNLPHPGVPEKLQAEVDPMQSVLIDDQQILIFRRIVLGNQIFRQGFVLKTPEFLSHLITSHFSGQPMSRFTHLSLKVADGKRQAASSAAGVWAEPARFSLERNFPRPFSFLQASLTCRNIPRSAGRQTLNIMAGTLAGIMLIGLALIYRSARTIVELSERRSQFVSSVTHELKTPLTNIRMYIEMLEQGIARTPEREGEYFRILGSESARLSRLINNILEFSKLEKKQLYLNWQTGDLKDAVREVQEILGETLRKEGFTLRTEIQEIPSVDYDREVMIQVLINLLENSIKFGKNSSPKDIIIRLTHEGKWVHLSVSDTGPGIPRHALKKVFDDFYRVEDPLIRTTRGTGIGLAFVRKVVTAMGGRVTAMNNGGPGCAIILSLSCRP
jgi:signal transduction histidine kinase